jgi:general secretion pathway protein N
MAGGGEMTRRATVCLMLAGVACAAGEAIAQAPAQVNLIEGDFNRTAPGPTQQDSPQQNLGQPDLPQPPIASRVRPPQDRPQSANPLWEIPLATLAATRDRPVFSPSRRPVPPAVTAPLIEPAAAPLVEAAEPESPPFTLLGTVVDTGESLAIFLSQVSNSVVRRHIGEEEAGWILQSVDARTATLEKNALQATLTLPPHDAERMAQGESNNLFGQAPGQPFPGPGAGPPRAGVPIASGPPHPRRRPQP